MGRVATQADRAGQRVGGDLGAASRNEELGRGTEEAARLGRHGEDGTARFATAQALDHLGGRRGARERQLDAAGEDHLLQRALGHGRHRPGHGVHVGLGRAQVAQLGAGGVRRGAQHGAVGGGQRRLGQPGQVVVLARCRLADDGDPANAVGAPSEEHLGHDELPGGGGVEGKGAQGERAGARAAHPVLARDGGQVGGGLVASGRVEEAPGQLEHERPPEPAQRETGPFEEPARGSRHLDGVASGRPAQRRGDGAQPEGRGRGQRAHVAPRGPGGRPWRVAVSSWLNPPLSRRRPAPENPAATRRRRSSGGSGR